MALAKPFCRTFITLSTEPSHGTIVIANFLKTRPESRPLLTPAGWLCLGLSLVGCLAVFNATFHLHNPYQFVAGQVLWILPSALVLIAATRCPQGWLWRLVLPLSVIVLFGMWSALLRGVHVNGAFPWFNVQGVRVQIAELGKPVFALVVAWVFHKTEENSELWLQGFLPVLAVTIIWLMPMLVTPAPGVLAVYLFPVFVLILCTGRPVKHGLVFGAVGLLLVGAAFHFAPPSEVAVVSGALSQTPSAWHTEQFRRALASGGLFGRSLGHGMWSQSNLPPAHHGSVFAALGESLGLFGLIPILLLLIAWVLHGWRGAKNQGDPLNAHAVVLLTALPATQALLHLSVNLGILPMLSMPLPLISHGGSSLLATFAIVGLVENLRREKT